MKNSDAIKRLRTIRLEKQRQAVERRHKVRTNGDADELREIERDSEALRIAIAAIGDREPDL